MPAKKKIKKKSSRPSHFENPSVDFSSLSGFFGQKQAVRDIIAYCRDPRPFNDVNAYPPRGLLFSGSAGTGKKIFAEAVAGEAKMRLLRVPSWAIAKHADNAVSNIDRCFKALNDALPTLILFEDIDRTALAEDGDEDAINRFQDFFSAMPPNMPWFFVGTTENVAGVSRRIGSRTLLGDRLVPFSTPLFGERVAIIEGIKREYPAFGDSAERMASLTVGMGHAEMRQLINAAAVHAALAKSERVTHRHVAEAYEELHEGFLMIGHDHPAEDRLMTSYHEAGHAVVAHFHPFGRELEHVSVAEREQSSGETVAQGNDFGRSNYGELVGEIATVLGGYVVERRIGKTDWRTRHCRSDLVRANDVAAKMVCWWGLGERTGARVRMAADEKPDLSHPETERDVADLVALAEKTAEQLITKNWKKLVELATALADGEGIITSEELVRILGPRPRRPKNPLID